jgi:hypothetical protein
VTHRGPTRVSLISWRNDRTEIEKDTIVAVECMVANRGNWRRGDVATIPITVGFMQRWLKLTGARRRGRDYARDCIATAVELELIEDTKTVLKPRKQPSSLDSYWWRVFSVCALRNLRSAHRSGGSASLPVCLRRWADAQGLIYRRPRPSPGSVQWEFANYGPP